MLLSIITVVFNNVAEIEKTIKSVLNQSYDNIEYIIIDGNSTDGTIDVINNYKSNIDVIISEKDNGIYEAMNKGWRCSNGEYCLFLNSGDYLNNDTVVENVVVQLMNNNFDIVYGNLYAFDEIQNWVSVFNEPISLYYFSYSFLPHPASFIKKSLLQNLKGFNENYKIISDWIFFINAFASKASFFWIDLTITSFYMKGRSSTANYDVNERDLVFSKELSYLKNDFDHFKRLRHFDTSILTKKARQISAFKMKYFK